MADSLTSLIASLLPLAKTAKQYAHRLRKEHQSALAGDGQLTDDLNLPSAFEQTLSRLVGGVADEHWWRKLSSKLSQPYVAPEFLRHGALQVWLKEKEVQDGLKTLATAELIGDEPPTDVRPRLQQLYSQLTGAPAELATAPIEVLVGILLAGYFAEFDTGQHQLAQLTSQTSLTIRRKLDRIEDKLDKGAGSGLEEMVARKEEVELIRSRLSTIQKIRTLRIDEARNAIGILLEQSESLNSTREGRALRWELYYWTARLLTTHQDRIQEAREHLNRIEEETSPGANAVVEALILNAEGHADQALRLLRDLRTPDAQSVLFAILVQNRGPKAGLNWLEQNQGEAGPGFLTGSGWFNVGVALARTGEWVKAAQHLRVVRKLTEECPALLFLEGLVNAALLLPEEMRPEVLELTFFHPSIGTAEGRTADHHRQVAFRCFRQAEDLFAEIHPSTSKAAARWLLWIRLTSPSEAERTSALEEISRQMTTGRDAISLVPVATALQLDFDAGRLWRYLDQRAQVGGLEPDELVARFHIAERMKEAAQFIDFLDAEFDALSTVLPTEYLLGRKLELLVEIGETKRARRFLDEVRQKFSTSDAERLSILIASREGEDPRDRLEELYRKDPSYFNLLNLANHLASARDWESLLPLQKELFSQQRTKKNAVLLVHCLNQTDVVAPDQVLEFLDDNSDLVETDLELQSLRAWTLAEVGQLTKAKEINDCLLAERRHSVDLQLDINIALQTGQWERFSGIIEREWKYRRDHTPETLLRLASLAVIAYPTPDRAQELICVAVSLGTDDPEVLVTAAGMTYRLGTEGPHTAEWLGRALQLQPEGGPIRRIDLPTVVKEWMPAHRERVTAIERHWIKGELPLHVVADALNLPLSHFLLKLPSLNRLEPDARRRAFIPIFSEFRDIIEIRETLHLGLDIASLLVLHYLELLDEVLETFDTVYLAPDTQVQLLNEITEARFHQPSRIRAAEELLDLVDRDVLRVTQEPKIAPESLKAEVGTDLAQLLTLALDTGGLVVRPLPVEKVGSLAEETAELGPYEPLVISPRTFTRLLYLSSRLTEERYRIADRHLAMHEPDCKAGFEITVLNSPLYLDDLTLSYLQSAGVVQILPVLNLDLRVHPGLKHALKELIDAGKEGEQIALELDSIRKSLRDAHEHGRIRFLRRPSVDLEKEVFPMGSRADSLIAFLGDSSPCDAICIDDRYLNSKSSLIDGTGKRVPLLCTLDLIMYLHRRGLDREQPAEARPALTRTDELLYKLRESGFGLVPVDHEEMARLLVDPQGFSAEDWIERPELRAIRHSLAQMRTLRGTHGLGFEKFLLQVRSAGLAAIKTLWTQEQLPSSKALLLTDWLWRYLAPSPADWFEVGGPDDSEAFCESLKHHILLMLILLSSLPPEVSEAFRDWLDVTILRPLVAANVDLLDSIAADLGSLLEERSLELAEEADDNSDS